MITTVTATAGAGSVNICLPIRVRPGDTLSGAHAADLTTANQLVGIFLAPSKFTAITQDAAMPTDVLSECCCLAIRTQTAIHDRVAWSGRIKIDSWAPVVLGLFVNCQIGDRVQLSVNLEDPNAK